MKYVTRFLVLAVTAAIIGASVLFAIGLSTEVSVYEGFGKAAVVAEPNTLYLLMAIAIVGAVVAFAWLHGVVRFFGDIIQGIKNAWKEA
jgi:threonine/homoserine/homoserine lactone efflux protein